MTIRFISKIATICGIFGCANFAYADDFKAKEALTIQFQQDGITWSNAGPADFSALLGDSFTVLTDSNHSMDLNLIEVIAGDPDPNRPSFLDRSQSVIAVFQSSKQDREWLAKSGAQMAHSWHPALGNGRVYISAVKTRDGDYSIEIVLN